MSDLIELIDGISSFIAYFKARRDHIDKLCEKVLKSVAILEYQTDIYLQSESANPDPTFVSEFPDAKGRLLTKLRKIIDTEIKQILRVAEDFLGLSGELQKSYLKLDQNFKNINWENQEAFLLPIMKLISWAERCWKYHHALFIDIDTAMKGYALDKVHSETWLNRLKLFNQNRDIIYHDPVISTFDSIVDDVYTRSKVENSLARD